MSISLGLVFLEVYFNCPLESLKSDKKLWPKYENWSKLENRTGVYRYMSNMYRYMLAKNDQNTKCTGTCSKCTGTNHPGMPRMCLFSPFSIFLIPNSTLYFIYTSRPLHMSLVNSFLLNSSFNTYLLSTIYPKLLSNPL